MAITYQRLYPSQTYVGGFLMKGTLSFCLPKTIKCCLKCRVDCFAMLICVCTKAQILLRIDKRVKSITNQELPLRAY